MPRKFCIGLIICCQILLSYILKRILKTSTYSSPYNPYNRRKSWWGCSYFGAISPKVGATLAPPALWLPRPWTKLYRYLITANDRNLVCFKQSVSKTREHDHSGTISCNKIHNNVIRDDSFIFINLQWGVGVRGRYQRLVDLVTVAVVTKSTPRRQGVWGQIWYTVKFNIATVCATTVPIVAANSHAGILKTKGSFDYALLQLRPRMHKAAFYFATANAHAQFCWRNFSVRQTRALRYKMLSYRRETVLQGILVLAESGSLELGDNILLI